MTREADPVRAHLLTRAEALAGGSSDRELSRLVRRGQLRRIRSGAYVASDHWDPLNDEERHRLLARAVLSKAGTPAVLSHQSAALEHGAPTWRLDLGSVHVTRRDGKAGRREAGVHQHRTRLLDRDVMHRHGVPVTSPTRLGLDVAATSPLEVALVLVNHLLHANLTTHQALVTRYQSMQHDPGTLRTGLLLGLADARIESVGESRTWLVCWRHGVPCPIPQYAVCDGGIEIARLDFAWPDLGCWVEFDGKQKYVQFLRDGETVADAVLREKQREDRVRELTGWRCLRITWAELADPERLARRIAAFLGITPSTRRVTPDRLL